MRISRKFGLIALIMVALVLIYVGGFLVTSEYISHRLESPPRLKIVNRSGEDLEELVVEVVGFSEYLGSLSAGESRTITVYPTGESGVRLSFVTGEQHVTSDYQGYIEPSTGYRMVVRIDRDFEVGARSVLFLLP